MYSGEFMKFLREIVKIIWSILIDLVNSSVDSRR